MKFNVNNMSKQLGFCAFLLLGTSQMAFAQSKVRLVIKVKSSMLQANLSLVLLLKKKVPIMA